MLNSVDFSGRPFHFIGIGGIGMSALAYVLAQRRLPVSGSDLRLSKITQRLQTQGVRVFWPQDAANLKALIQPLPTDSEFSPYQSGPGASEPPVVAPLLPQVVCSTAISPSNPEYRAAVEMGCAILHRSDILAALMSQYKGVAVAGTHGKTTTSSMIGYLLLQAGLDPTIVVGGEVSAWDGNAYAGKSEYMVAEADESDGSLVKLSPYIGVITNVELDHPDHYSSLDEVIEIFKQFSQQCQITIGSIDCSTVRDALKPTISYSLHPESEADYVADDIRHTGTGTVACVWERGKLLGEIRLQLLGRHNLSNALAAVAVARVLGVDFAAIAAILTHFEGAKRRFDRRGCYNDILFVDDYAHHPSEIKVTLAAARLQSTEPLPSGVYRRVVAVFQPHRYSRTVTLLHEFATAFADADCVIVTDIYAAGEENPSNITGQTVVDAIAEYHSQVTYVPTLDAVQEHLGDRLRPGDIVLFLTAGNLNHIIPAVMEICQHREYSTEDLQVEEVLSSV